MRVRQQRISPLPRRPLQSHSRCNGYAIGDGVCRQHTGRTGEDRVARQSGADWSVHQDMDDLVPAAVEHASRELRCSGVYWVNMCFW